MNILIIRLSSIGDVIHALATVAPLKARFPDCSITWVIEEEAAGLVDCYQGIDRILVSHRKQWLKDLSRWRLTQAARGILGFVRDLRQDHYDLVLDFQGLFKSGVLAFLARGTKKIGYSNAREFSRIFYTETAPAPDFHDHAINRHLSLLRGLGVDGKPEPFSSFFNAEDRESLENVMEQEQISRQMPFVCIHPCAKWPTKLWAPEKVARLCDLLQSECCCQVLIVGGAGERQRLQHMCSQARTQVINLSGKTTLRELACLVSQSVLMISMDSGPMHLACAVGTPVVALFGPTAPWRTGPFGTQDSIIRKQLPCGPCFQKSTCPEGHYRCMADITVEDVYKVCCNYLTKTI